MSWITGQILYNLGIRLYRLLIYLLVPFNHKAGLMIRGRQHSAEMLKTFTHNQKKKVAWFHCASLGEFEQIRPLIEKFKSEKPEFVVAVTFFSPSGYEIRKNYPLADFVGYIPFDTPVNARNFIASLDPAMAFFAKYDIWCNMLFELKKRAIPAFLISAQFRKDQIYFKKYGAFFRSALGTFKHIFSQFEDSTLLLQAQGILNATTSGDTRYDRVSELSYKTEEVPLIRLFKQQKWLVILGSSYAPEESVALKLIQSYSGRVKLIVAPHQVEIKRIRQLQNTFKNCRSILFSQANPESVLNADVLIIDSIGMLGKAYASADFALVGGGFGKKGIHNILEPLAQGVPVWIGPENHEKYPETSLAIQYGVVRLVRKAEDIGETLKEWDLNKLKKEEATQLCKRFILDHAGATKCIWDAIFL